LPFFEALFRFFYRRVWHKDNVFWKSKEHLLVAIRKRLFFVSSARRVKKAMAELMRM